jgi:hypothetical protein
VPCIWVYSTPTRFGWGRIDSAPKGPTKAYNPLFLTRYSLVLLDRATFPLRPFCSSDRKQSSNIFTILKALPSHDTARSHNNHRVPPPAHYNTVKCCTNVSICLQCKKQKLKGKSRGYCSVARTWSCGTDGNHWLPCSGEGGQRV